MTHESLLSQLRDMKAPSREMDAEIQLALFGNCVYGTVGPRNSPRPGNLASYVEQYRDLLTADDDLDDEVVPRFTASVDAAIALAERLLPGCDICTQDIPLELRREDEPRHIAEIMHDLQWTSFEPELPPEPEYTTYASGKSNSRAIAILIAVLSALSAINRREG